MLLEVVPFPADVGGNFYPVGQPDTGNLAQRRIGFLGRHRAYLYADTPALWAARTPLNPVPQGVLDPMHGRRFGLFADRLPTLPNKLIDCRHRNIPARQTGGEL